jgi:hypothetical protein
VGWSMMRLILRRSMPRSRAIARWLRPAVCQARTACSTAGVPVGTSGAPCNRFRRSLVRVRRGDGCRPCGWSGSDEGHEEFEGAGQSQGGPGADQCADGAVAEAVGQIGADGGGDAGAQAPARQGWNRHGATAGVEDEHAGGQDEPVDGEGQEPGGEADLAVGGDEFVCVPVGMTAATAATARAVVTQDCHGVKLASPWFA